MLALKFLVVLLSMACSMILVQGRLLVVGDVSIKMTKDHFRCDHLACPKSTHRCVVVKENQPNDLSNVLRSNICYSRSHKVLKKSLTYETSKDNKEIRQLFEVSRDGHANVLSSTDFDEMEFSKKYSQFQKGLSKNADKLNRNLEKVEHRLEHIFA
ncbi:uncharacterized protein LOC106085967 [Stomoxys calcitrans]|uniref:uncharacterized protein LOC106085967 n=1 Tax=Stomoxys calcitrans TaxID=35570 RepID=UPI0027E265B3|nr:uncharacterized protein LOC106085967 [Stomoxys calcitrans]